MIVVENRLRDIFSQIPEIQVNLNNLNKPFFSWGEKEELNRYVMKEEQLNSQGEPLYPLIWLLPSVDTHNILSNLVVKDVVLILATRETKNNELYNPQRLKGSFEKILDPLTDYVIQGLQNSNITRITKPEDIKILKKPNYSESGQNGVIDKWDAIRIECEVEFNNQCLNTIKWI